MTVKVGNKDKADEGIWVSRNAKRLEVDGKI